jgi:hypothetical protein
MSEPSTADAGVAAWTSSLRATRASRSARPVDVVARRIRAICGPTFSESSRRSVQPSSSWRTSPATLLWDTPTSELDWRPLATELRRLSSQRRTSARATSARDFSSSPSESPSWPTPVAQDGNGHVGEYPSTDRRNPGLNLATAADQHVDPRWPTPSAGDEKWRATENTTNDRRERGKQLSLEAISLQWPTPRAEDAEAAGNHPGAHDALNAEAREWATPTSRDYKGGYTDEAMIRKDGKSRLDDLLPQQVEHWPTPRPTDENMDRRSPEAMERESQREGRGQNLALTALTQWPTPSAEPFDGDPAVFEARRQKMADQQGNNGAGVPLAIAAQMATGEPASCPSSPRDPATATPGGSSSMSTHRSRRRLNPRFVSWLMGWPLIARACSGCSATASSPLQAALGFCILWVALSAELLDGPDAVRVLAPGRLVSAPPAGPERVLRVLIRDTRDGREAWHEERHAADDDLEHLLRFMWTEGNYSCDCNRSLFFARALGEPERASTGYCIGEGRYVVVEATLGGEPFNLGAA